MEDHTILTTRLRENNYILIITVKYAIESSMSQKFEFLFVIHLKFIPLFRYQFRSSITPLSLIFLSTIRHYCYRFQFFVTFFVILNITKNNSSEIGYYVYIVQSVFWRNSAPLEWIPPLLTGLCRTASLWCNHSGSLLYLHALKVPLPQIFLKFFNSILQSI